MRLQWSSCQSPYLRRLGLPRELLAELVSLIGFSCQAQLKGRGSNRGLGFQVHDGQPF
jgi:hypothetical protein